jgi:hypothetical protein
MEEARLEELKIKSVLRHVKGLKKYQVTKMEEIQARS